MMRLSANRPRDASRTPQEATKPLPGTSAPPNFSGVLPGAGWVADHLDPETNVRTIIPLIGWLVDAAGECHALPRNLGPEWNVRPVVDGDERLIRQSAAAMQTKPNNHQQTDWNRWRTHLQP